MGLLAPLYALAALALAGPILFHLIRRQPRGEIHFSSLMFLAPSPPRVTRRSRLDNLWLLLLRVLAILLIAAAFMRPFLRQDSLNETALSGRRIVLLLDTSGSMQRPDVWASAQRIAGEVLDDLASNDYVALYTIDRQLTAHLPLSDQPATDPRDTQRAARQSLAKLKPTWHTTALVEGLKSTADLLVAQSISEEPTPDRLHQIVLISDLHRGVPLAGLQGFVWPENVQLDVRQVLPDTVGNAWPGLMQDDASAVTQANFTETMSGEPRSDDTRSDETRSGETRSGTAAKPTRPPVGSNTESSISQLRRPTQRLRIENDSDSPADGLPVTLAWSSPQGPLPDQVTQLQVPPGQVRVIPLDSRPPSADRIVLAGDAWDGDNTLYTIQPNKISQRILFCGREPSEPEDDLSYFLKQAPLDSAGVQRTLEIISADALAVRLLDSEVRAVVLEPTPAVLQQAPAIEQFAENGGIVLICFSQPVPGEIPTAPSPAKANEVMAMFLQALLQEPQLEISEANSEDFSLLARIDFAHPIFVPLSDPRFNDFSKLRFWSHRRVAVPVDSNVRTVASFEDGTAWMLETSRGAGRVWVLTAGWQPTASGLGLSSKFIPLMMGILAPTGDTNPTQTHYAVGDKIGLANSLDSVITTDQGEVVDASLIVRHADAVEILRPGLYWLQSGAERRQVAVQVPVSESLLAALDVAELEVLGIAVRPLLSDAQRRESQRQLQHEELEDKQRLWQWLLVAGLVVLGLETCLAAWQSR